MKYVIALHEYVDETEARLFKSEAGALRWKREIAAGLAPATGRLLGLTPPTDPEALATWYFDLMGDRGQEWFSFEEYEPEED